MLKPYTQLFVHLVWATWDRAPLLEPWLRPVVDGAVREECARLRVEVIAFGAVSDHVHLLVRLPTTVSIAGLVKQVKGATSHLINRRLQVSFKWQGRYGAFTVSKPMLPRARDYVLNQEQHHRDGTQYPSVELD